MRVEWMWVTSYVYPLSYGSFNSATLKSYGLSIRQIGIYMLVLTRRYKLMYVFFFKTL